MTREGARAPEDLPLATWDRWQRRHPVVGLPLAVLYKFVDDQGAYLAVLITYYTFVSVVPVTLLATSVLGFALDGNPELRDRLLESGVAGFPVIGDQLGRPEGLQGSALAITVGAAFAIYGSLGLGTALQNAVLVAWSVPRNSRPNPVLIRVRSFSLLVAGGLALVTVSGASAVVQFAADRVDDAVPVARVSVPVAGVLVVTGILTLLTWTAAGRRHPLRAALPGSLLVAIAWQALQLGSAALVQQQLAQASSMNQTFGLVLGLMAVVHLGALVLVLGVEANVVLHRRLWPRALLTPFTDAVRLTEADRRAYTGYARAQRHKGFETVEVEFAPSHIEGESRQLPG